MNQQRIMLGAGGHARVLLDELSRTGISCDGIVDPNRDVGTEVSGVPVIANQELAPQMRFQGALLVNGVGMIPGKLARLELARKMAEEGREAEQVISGSSTISPTASLHSGVQILTKAVVNCDATIGRDAVINTAALVEHDVLIGARAWVSPGAVICGGVEIGEEAYIGAGAIILQGLKVGSQAVVGAGSVVTKSVGSREKVVPKISFNRN